MQGNATQTNVSSALATFGSSGRVMSREDLAYAGLQMQTLALQQQLSHPSATSGHLAAMDPNLTHRQLQADSVRYSVTMGADYVKTSVRIGHSHGVAPRVHSSENAHNRAPEAQRAKDEKDKKEKERKLRKAERRTSVIPPSAAQTAGPDIPAWISQSSNSGPPAGHESLPASPIAPGRPTPAAQRPGQVNSQATTAPAQTGRERGEQSARPSRSFASRISTYISDLGNPERLTLVKNTTPAVVHAVPVAHAPAPQAPTPVNQVYAQDPVHSQAHTHVNAAAALAPAPTILSAGRRSTRDAPPSGHSRPSVVGSRSRSGRGSTRSSSDHAPRAPTEATVDLNALGRPQVKNWPHESRSPSDQDLARMRGAGATSAESLPPLGQNLYPSIDARLTSLNSSSGLNLHANSDVNGNARRVSAADAHAHGGHGRPGVQESGTTSLSSSQVLEMPTHHRSRSSRHGHSHGHDHGQNAADTTAQSINGLRMTQAQAPAPAPAPPPAPSATPSLTSAPTATSTTRSTRSGERHRERERERETTVSPSAPAATTGLDGQWHHVDLQEQEAIQQSLQDSARAEARARDRALAQQQHREAMQSISSPLDVFRGADGQILYPIAPANVPQQWLHSRRGDRTAAAAAVPVNANLTSGGLPSTESDECIARMLHQLDLDEAAERSAHAVAALQSGGEAAELELAQHRERQRERYEELAELRAWAQHEQQRELQGVAAGAGGGGGGGIHRNPAIMDFAQVNRGQTHRDAGSSVSARTDSTVRPPNRGADAARASHRQEQVPAAVPRRSRWVDVWGNPIPDIHDGDGSLPIIPPAGDDWGYSDEDDERQSARSNATTVHRALSRYSDRTYPPPRF